MDLVTHSDDCPPDDTKNETSSDSSSKTANNEPVSNTRHWNFLSKQKLYPLILA